MTRFLRRTLIVTGAIVILGIACIGLVQAAARTAHDQPSPVVPVALTSGSAEDASDSVVLDAAFAADQVATDPATADRAAAKLLRLRFWQRLVHATATLDLPNKGLTTVQLDHGTVAAIDADSLTIAEKGGSSVTVAIGEETRYRKNAKRAKPTEIKTGDEVYVMSLVESGGSEAYLVVVPKR